MELLAKTRQFCAREYLNTKTYLLTKS